MIACGPWSWLLFGAVGFVIVLAMVVVGAAIGVAVVQQVQKSRADG